MPSPHPTPFIAVAAHAPPTRLLCFKLLGFSAPGCSRSAPSNKHSPGARLCKGPFPPCSSAVAVFVWSAAAEGPSAWPCFVLCAPLMVKQCPAARAGP